MPEPILFAFFGLPLLYAVAQIAALACWDGIAQKLAALPVLAWGIYGLLFFFQTIDDPGSHNLFPFELILGSLSSLLYLAVCAAIRWIVAGLVRLCGRFRPAGA